VTFRDTRGARPHTLDVVSTSQPPDAFGRSALHYAALGDDLETAAALLWSGADPSAKDRQGMAPLHFAAQEGSLRVAELLLEQGADVDSEDGNGNTPLSTAVFCSRGAGDMIQLLRARGADPLKRNRYGQTPVSLARLIANYPVAQWFEDLPA
jgi:ankyrin repeat protein